MKHFKLCTGSLLIRSSDWFLGTVEQQVKWLNDPEVMKYSEQRHRIHSLTTQVAYINTFSGNSLFLAIYLGSEMIGTMTVYADDYNGIANVGILIGDKTKWGFGYGSDAWEMVCQHLLATGTRKIEAGCMAINNPMIKICQHYGMTEEGRQKDHFIISGKPTDLIHWGKFK